MPGNPEIHVKQPQVLSYCCQHNSYYRTVIVLATSTQWTPVFCPSRTFFQGHIPKCWNGQLTPFHTWSLTHSSSQKKAIKGKAIMTQLRSRNTQGVISPNSSLLSLPTSQEVCPFLSMESLPWVLNTAGQVHLRTMEFKQFFIQPITPLRLSLKHPATRWIHNWTHSVHPVIPVNHPLRFVLKVRKFPISWSVPEAFQTEEWSSETLRNVCCIKEFTSFRTCSSHFQNKSNHRFIFS